MGREVLYRQPMTSSSRQMISGAWEMTLLRLVLESIGVGGMSLRSSKFIEVFMSRVITCLEGLFISGLE